MNTPCLVGRQGQLVLFDDQPRKHCMQVKPVSVSVVHAAKLTHSPTGVLGPNANIAPLLAPAVTVGETEGAMDSTSVFFLASSFAYNFV